jgi:hypothetical protein
MKTAENWIPDEQLPPSAGLRVIYKNNPDHGLSEDEIQDRNEFIRCYLFKDFELLMIIPKQDTTDDSFITDCGILDAEYCAFNTHDFQKQMRPFNMEGYKMKKIMERVKDMAIMHSCASEPKNQQLVFERFISFMDFEFVNQVEELAKQLHTDISYTEQLKIRREIDAFSRKIGKCKKVWERYAPAENWDL